jgi:transcriptional regulator with PAS, ATPase and Fis domain
VDIQTIKQRFGIIGSSVGLNHALSIAAQVAPTDLTVLITGESGTGKEAFSHIIHQLSARKHSPFIAVNCGAIPEGTIDSELFGHEKGSFTGAIEARKGYFEFVNGGTIFLDEVAELPLGTQARLLRVLETKEFIRVGSSKVQKTDVRVVAATNINLLERIQVGRFREDLYYRMNTVPIKVPPLRERPEDIYILFRKFSLDFSERYRTQSVSLTEEAKQMLVHYPFPGNVRELKNLAEQVSVLAKDKLVDAVELRHFLPDTPVSFLPMTVPHANGNGTQDFSNERELMYKVLFDMKNDLNELKKVVYGLMSGNAQMVTPSYPQHSASLDTHQADRNQAIVLNEKQIDVEPSLSLVDNEKDLILKALRKHRGKRKDAAQDLGISERTLYRKIKEYNLDE